MNKSQAVRYLNSRVGQHHLSSANCNFSNINKAVPLWWLNINPDRFGRNLYLILHDRQRLLLFFIPAGTFYPPEDHFSIRKDKNMVDLRISSVQNKFYLRDLLSGGTRVNFEAFLIHKEPVNEEYKLRLKEKPNLFSEPAAEKPAPPAKPHQFILKRNQTGISYQKLFGEYLQGATDITLQDPYIRLRHQFENLLEFCMMLEKNKSKEKPVNLKVVTWNLPEYQNMSTASFEDLKMGVRPYGINLEYKYEDQHDRYIQANNGWKITLGRGLDIFEKPESQFSIAVKDQTKRKCRPCEMTYLRTQNKSLTEL